MSEDARNGGERSSLLSKGKVRWQRANAASAIATCAVLCLALAYFDGRPHRIEEVSCCSKSDASCCREGPKTWFPGSTVVNINPTCGFHSTPLPPFVCA